jgi:hypothetical protein
MTQDIGASASAETGSRPTDGAQEVSTLTGLDPARINFAGISELVERQLEDAEPILRRWNVSWQQRPNGLRLIGFVVPDEDAIRWNKSLFALFELAKSAPLFLRELQRAAAAFEEQSR